MKKHFTQFRYLKKTEIYKPLLLLGLFMLSFVNSYGQVFNENFTGSNLTSMSSGLTYTSNLGTSPATTGSVSLSSGVLTIFNGNNATSTSNSSGFGYVTATNSGFLSPYSSTLANNYSVTWSFNIRSSRTGAVYSSTTASGSYDILAILACDNADPTNSAAKGIAVVGIRGSTGTANAYNLIAFSNGVLGLTNSNQTQIAKSADFSATFAAHYWAIKVTYVSSTNLWTLSTRDDGTGGFVNPATTGAAWTDVSGTCTVNTNLPLTGFGFAWGFGTSTGNNAYFDNFKVAVNVPISVNQSTLSGFTYETGSGPSASQSFDVSGTNLTGYPSNITVTGTTNYEVSTDNSTFSNSVNVPFTSSTLSATTIYVRLKSGLSVLNYNNEVITTSLGAASGSTVTCSGSVYGTPTTYTWNATGTASFATPTNWSPSRTTPQTNDILVFNGGGTVVATGLTSQTIAQLLISNNTSVELQSVAPATLTIAGTTGTDLSLSAGSEFNILQATNIITVTLISGATATISGVVNYNSAAHLLTAADANAIVFQNGAVFNAGSLFSGNAFGTTSLGSVKFTNGSTYIQGGGSNPFAAVQPNSVAVFQTGSLYKCTGTTSPSYSGRTYANFEMDQTGRTQNNQGSSLATFDNFTITNGTFNWDFSGGVVIKGNISVAPGAVLTFGNATKSTLLTLSGTGNQTIEVNGTLTNGANSTYVIANSAGVNISSNISLTDLTINSGSVLNVNAGRQLTVSSAFTNNGTLNLLSNSESGTATILPPAGMTESGITTVQQYLPNARNWYISTPVTDALAPSGYTYYQRDESSSSWTSLPFVAGDTFTTGKGYIALPALAGSTITFSGKMNNGNVSTALTSSGSGYNLIGNPYPAHLGWTYSFVNENASLIEPTIWVRTNAGTTNNSNQWSFVTYNAVSSESVPSVGNGGIIAPMQAFWVKAKTAGTLILNNSLTKSHQVANPLKVPSQNSERKRIRMIISNGQTLDETLLYFDANASDYFDQYDSPKMSNNSSSIPEIYSIAGSEQLVINGMNTVSDNLEIPIGIMAGINSNLSLSISELSNFDPETRIMLVDKLLNTSVELHQNTVYEFNSANITSANNRFSLLFKVPGVTTNSYNPEKNNTSVFVNALNEIEIIAPYGSNYSIYSVEGKCIATGKVKNHLLHTVQLAKGAYVIRINNETNKVII